MAFCTESTALVIELASVQFTHFIMSNGGGQHGKIKGKGIFCFFFFFLTLGQEVNSGPWATQWVDLPPSLINTNSGEVGSNHLQTGQLN